MSEDYNFEYGEAVEDIAGYREQLGRYVEIPGGAIVPSASRRKNEALQPGTFDPHAPYPQLIDGDENAVWEPGDLDSYKNHPDYKSGKVPVPQAKKASESASGPQYEVTIHVEGKQVPIKYDSVSLDVEKNLLALTRIGDGSNVPNFDLALEEDGTAKIVFSIRNMDGYLLSCSYFGQSFVIQDQLHVTVFVIDSIEKSTKIDV